MKLEMLCPSSVYRLSHKYTFGSAPTHKSKQARSHLTEAANLDLPDLSLCAVDVFVLQNCVVSFSLFHCGAKRLPIILNTSTNIDTTNFLVYTCLYDNRGQQHTRINLLSFFHEASVCRSMCRVRGHGNIPVQTYRQCTRLQPRTLYLHSRYNDTHLRAYIVHLFIYKCNFGRQNCIRIHMKGYINNYQRTTSL